jgi:fumarate reductase subunit D
MLAAQRLKRRIKQTPVVWNLFSAGRALFGSLVRQFRL